MANLQIEIWHCAHLVVVVMSKVGTIPIKIRRFVEALQKGTSASTHVETAIRRAELDLAGFKHRSILRALRFSPDGITVATFGGSYDKGVNLAMPQEIAALKSSQAVVYHLPSGEYRLSSTAHRTALLMKPVWAYWF